MALFDASSGFGALVLCCRLRIFGAGCGFGVCVCVWGGGAHCAGGLISISRGFFASVGGVFVLVGVLGAGLSLCGALGL